jgi:hypothetical protein
MVAIAPTFAQPELAPYRRSGQLAAVLATVREGAAYAELIGEEGTGDHAPSALAMLAGMIAAIAVLVRQLLGALPAMRRRATREQMDEDLS